MSGSTACVSGSPKRRVELDHGETVVRLHQPRVEQAAEGAPVVGERAQRRVEDRVARLRQELGRGDRHRRVGAHAPRVRAGVALADPLVVLGREEEERPLAVGEREDRELLALHAVLDHDLAARLAEGEIAQHGSDGLERLLHGLAHDGALAGGEPRGLHDDGGAPLADVRLGLVALAEGPVVRGGDARAAHEVLRVGLARLDARGVPGRAEDGEPLLHEAVDDARGQRSLRAHHGEVDALRGRPARQRLDVRRRDRDGLAERGHAPVRAGGEELGVRRVASELPQKGVLTPAVSYDQDAHGGKIQERGARATRPDAPPCRRRKQASAAASRP